MGRPLSRGAFTAMTASAFAGIGVVRAPARAAQFQYKYGNDQSVSSPVTVRAVEVFPVPRGPTKRYACASRR